MHSTEREAFEKELAVLFGGFPQFLTPPRIEAYWRGLRQMSISTFVRCVDEALGEGGLEKAPTVNTIWQLSRKLRAPAAKPQEKPAFDPPHCFGQRCLTVFMVREAIKDPPERRDIDEATLQRLVAVKNRLVDQLRSSGDGDDEAGPWGEVMLAAFEKAMPRVAA